MLKFLPLALLAATAAAAPAGAVTFTFTSAGTGVATVAPGYTLLNNFNAGTGLTGSGFSYYTTNISGEAAMPLGSDGSRYGGVRNGGSATASLGSGYRSVSLYIGSIDASNQITFRYLDGGTESLLGSQFGPPANGDQTAASTNGRFVFNAEGSRAFSSLTFGSGQNSFEFDDLAVAGAVPEPATWAMMMLGFGLVGAAARRRRMVPAQVAA